jgi:hypothetical protein
LKFKDGLISDFLFNANCIQIIKCSISDQTWQLNQIHPEIKQQHLWLWYFKTDNFVRVQLTKVINWNFYLWTKMFESKQSKIVMVAVGSALLAKYLSSNFDQIFYRKCFICGKLHPVTRYFFTPSQKSGSSYLSVRLSVHVFFHYYCLCLGLFVSIFYVLLILNILKDNFCKCLFSLFQSSMRDKNVDWQFGFIVYVLIICKNNMKPVIIF